MLDPATCFRIMLGVTFISTGVFLALSEHPCERYILMAALMGEICAILGELYGSIWFSQVAHVTFAACLLLLLIFAEQTCVMYYVVAMVVVREVTKLAYGKCLFEHSIEPPTNQFQSWIVHAAFLTVGSIFVFKIWKMGE